jgi:hypothetical protein
MSSSSRWRARRVVLRRAWPDAVPSAPDASGGQNVVSVGVLKGL